MRPDELAVAVDVWMRARWAAQPWLEERMAYTEEQNFAYFRDAAERHDVWVACVGNTVVGAMTLNAGEILQLHVCPQHHRRGIGSKLLQQARLLHPTRLALFTHQRNEGARRFYEAHGFVAVRFGTSPPPENEPDVRYEWTGASGVDA